MAAKIGIAIIGSGIFVTDEHLPAVLAHPNLSLKAIYSRTLTSAQAVSKDLQEVELYSEDSDNSYNDLLAREDIQAVIIALAIPVQAEFIKQALQAGKHVLAEKPLAKDLATATELLAWYTQNIDTSRISFSVAENWRYTNVFTKAAERVEELGKVQTFNVRLHFYIADGWKYTNSEWRKKPDFQGGYLLDSGVHLAAAVRLLLGGEANIKTISAFTSSLAKHLPPADTASMILQLENGSAGTVSLSFGSTFTDGDFSVACEKGAVRANCFTNEVISQPLGAEEKTEMAVDEQSNVKQEIAAWVEGLCSARPEPRLRPKEALADLEIIEAMLTSNGRPVELRDQI